MQNVFCESTNSEIIKCMLSEQKNTPLLLHGVAAVEIVTVTVSTFLPFICGDVKEMGHYATCGYVLALD